MSTRPGPSTKPAPALPPNGLIDAVLFDAGGVLILPDAMAGQRALEVLSCSSKVEDWHRAHYLANLVLDEMDVPDWPAVRRCIATEVGVRKGQLDEAVALIEDLILRTPWVALEGAERVFSDLSAAGYRTAVISNASGTVEQELESLGICSVQRNGVPRVELVIDSSVVGVAKPDPAIFELALNALGIEASRALYVGDTVKYDVRGATTAGLVPVHMDPFGLCAGEHSHVRSLGELVERLTPR